MHKTNAMRLLEQHGAAYIPHSYESGTAISAVDVAKALGRAPGQIFKTLVTAGRSGQYYVFIIPGLMELDLKKAAAASGEKSVAMVPSKTLFPLTGYVHGGCSPLAMKKSFPTFIDVSANVLDTIIISAGKIGLQAEITLDELRKALTFELSDLTQ
ncbi:MAG TPA: Cys-tRNA(Pro) deacylase [Bacillota bacterium]|nr:Cys-tRNA(Pro) deacylase [Bacillota bacterium]